MNSVGDLYENGLGTSRNLQMAMTWYQSAAAQGEPMAMYNVGLLYEAGAGVTRDDAEALAWFRKSAGLVTPRRCTASGKWYVDGRAVGADPVEGLAWYSVADLRYPPEDAAEAKSNRRSIEEISSRLSAEQLARARERTEAIDVLTRTIKPEPPKPLQPGEKSTLNLGRAALPGIAFALANFIRCGGYRPRQARPRPGPQYRTGGDVQAISPTTPASPPANISAMPARRNCPKPN